MPSLGCHHCNGCHNPDTWDLNGGIDLPLDYIPRIIELLRKNGVKRNLSILGGEPMINQNMAIIYPLIQMVKRELPDTKIFLWTGFTYEDLMNRKDWLTTEIIKSLDVLVDGKFQLENRDITLWLRGSPNQRVIDVQETLKENKICQMIN